jgi:hypothetical protein
MLALAGTLYRVELTGKRIRCEPARAPGAAGVTTAEKYVTGAYLVLLGALLLYLLIIAAQGLAARAGARRPDAGSAGEARWLSCSSGRRSSRTARLRSHMRAMRAGRIDGRLATWGVRVGWLVQTALPRRAGGWADAFPWDTWAGR